MMSVAILFHDYAHLASHISPALHPFQEALHGPSDGLVGGLSHAGENVLLSSTSGDGTFAPTSIDFSSLGGGLKRMLGEATGVLTLISAGFFGLLLALGCFAYAWNHNNPRKLQESRTAIVRVLEACALFGLIGALLGLVHTIVSFA